MTPESDTSRVRFRLRAVVLVVAIFTIEIVRGAIPLFLAVNLLGIALYRFLPDAVTLLALNGAALLVVATGGLVRILTRTPREAILVLESACEIPHNLISIAYDLTSRKHPDEIGALFGAQGLAALRLMRLSRIFRASFPGYYLVLVLILALSTGFAVHLNARDREIRTSRLRLIDLTVTIDPPQTLIVPEPRSVLKKIISFVVWPGSKVSLDFALPPSLAVVPGIERSIRLVSREGKSFGGCLRFRGRIACTFSAGENTAFEVVYQSRRSSTIYASDEILSSVRQLYPTQVRVIEPNVAAITPLDPAMPFAFSIVSQTKLKSLSFEVTSDIGLERTPLTPVKYAKIVPGSLTPTAQAEIEELNRTLPEKAALCAAMTTLDLRPYKKYFLSSVRVRLTVIDATGMKTSSDEIVVTFEPATFTFTRTLATILTRVQAMTAVLGPTIEHIITGTAPMSALTAAVETAKETFGRFRSDDKRLSAFDREVSLFLPRLKQTPSMSEPARFATATRVEELTFKIYQYLTEVGNAEIERIKALAKLKIANLKKMLADPTTPKEAIANMKASIKKDFERISKIQQEMGSLDSEEFVNEEMSQQKKGSMDDLDSLEKDLDAMAGGGNQSSSSSANGKGGKGGTGHGNGEGQSDADRAESNLERIFKDLKAMSDAFRKGDTKGAKAGIEKVEKGLEELGKDGLVKKNQPLGREHDDIKADLKRLRERLDREGARPLAGEAKQLTDRIVKFSDHYREAQEIESSHESDVGEDIGDQSVKIPDKNAFRLPPSMVEEIKRGGLSGFPEEYRDPVKDYFERLMK